MQNNKESGKIRLKLGIVLFITFVYMLAELIGGIISNSLALIADAGHMLGDIFALSMSFIATWIILKPASAEKTYGYYRAEILVALINGLVLVMIAGIVLHEGIQRFFSPQEIKAPLMIAVALGGLAVNLSGIIILRSSTKYNLNVKAAFLHIIGDTLGSIGAISAGLLIYFYKFYYADIIISLIIAVIITINAVRLIVESSNILLEGTPKNIDINEIKDTLTSLPEVKKVHELHVWSISLQRIALSIHVVSDHPDSHEVLCKVDKILRERFNIHHLTIQVEPPGFPERRCDF